MSDTIKGDPSVVPTGVGRAGWVDQLARRRQPGPSRIGHVNDAPLRALHEATRAVHSGSFDDPSTGAVGTPIYQTSTFILGEEQYRAVEEGYARDRFIYTRYGNPSQWAVQEKLAALEGAESALVFASGMAAISASVLAMLDKGAHIVASDELYGGTYNLFHHDLPSLGFTVSYVSPRDIAAVQAAVRPNTMLLYFEAMTNPLLKVVDVAALAEVARGSGARLMIDATFVTPLGCRPLELGADMVVHSCTKYLNGHSDLVAGVALGSRKLMDMVWPRLLAFGGCLDPHACFLLERGLKTLAVRMRAHQEGALKVAEFLSGHPRVRKTLYPGLASHPDHQLARRTLRNTGGMVSFNVASDAQALALLQRLHLMREATSLGGVETLISLPFNTSHAAFTAAQRARLGIEPGCVRLSVGIEHPDDLIADLDAALTAMPEA
ncbi:methionine-gamma-lyase [Variovorax sp. HW608]|uniref:trans-sulfuration enzyme family protein n=1 Tax=Variovorax sp. HW608 TaxID=1034889 RepID=UPI00081F7781|nr:PLP-dependent aspartate aminotransferase family protein [Variovorax sp. HW608]SCK30964.1 methionine-gamma-lyase [Variovorax sp. HW608]